MHQMPALDVAIRPLRPVSPTMRPIAAWRTTAGARAMLYGSALVLLVPGEYADQIVRSPRSGRAALEGMANGGC